MGRAYRGGLAALFTAGLLAGCAQTPSNFVVGPQIQGAQPLRANGEAIDVLCYDQRPDSNLMKLQTSFGDVKPQYLPSATDVTQQVCNELAEAWQQQGFSIQIDAPTQVQVVIQKMQVDLQQGRTRYQADSQVALQVTIYSDDSRLSQPFSGRAQSQGMLTADVASLERDFNQLLSQVLNDIALSQQLSDALK